VTSGGWVRANWILVTIAREFQISRLLDGWVRSVPAAMADAQGRPVTHEPNMTERINKSTLAMTSPRQSVILDFVQSAVRRLPPQLVQ